MAITYPTTLDTFALAVDNTTPYVAQDINDMRDAVEALETKAGIDTVKSVAQVIETGESITDIVYNFFETGRRLWLYENSAPTGWSHLLSVADRVLAVSGGSYNVAGGNQAGTWTQPPHTHTGPSHNHKWYDHQVYASDQTWLSDGSTKTAFAKTSVGNSYTFIKLGNDGTGVPGQDYYTKDEGTGNTGSGATAQTWRPYGAVGIIVKKD